MILRPPRSTRTDTLFPYTTLFRSKTLAGFASTASTIIVAISQIDRSFDMEGKPLPNLSNVRLPNPVERSIGSEERSEEHTSELQSLMRISYAVFCLKKKKKMIYNIHSTPYYNIQITIQITQT